LEKNECKNGKGKETRREIKKRQGRIFRRVASYRTVYYYQVYTIEGGETLPVMGLEKLAAFIFVKYKIYM